MPINELKQLIENKRRSVNDLEEQINIVIQNINLMKEFCILNESDNIPNEVSIDLLTHKLD